MIFRLVARMRKELNKPARIILHARPMSEVDLPIIKSNPIGRLDGVKVKATSKSHFTFAGDLGFFGLISFLLFPVIRAAP